MANSANSCRQVRNVFMALSNLVLQNNCTRPNLKEHPKHDKFAVSIQVKKLQIIAKAICQEIEIEGIIKIFLTYN
jgi:hypothetical protein